MQKKGSNPEDYRQAEVQVIQIQEGLIGVTTRFIPNFPVTPQQIGNSRGADGIFEKGTRMGLETLVFMAQHHACMDPNIMSRDLSPRNIQLIENFLVSRGMKQGDPDFVKFQNGLETLRIDRGHDGKQKPLLAQVYDQYNQVINPANVAIPAAVTKPAAMGSIPINVGEAFEKAVEVKASAMKHTGDMKFDRCREMFFTRNPKFEKIITAYGKAFELAFIKSLGKKDLHLGPREKDAIFRKVINGSISNWDPKIIAAVEELKSVPLKIILSTQDIQNLGGKNQVKKLIDEVSPGANVTGPSPTGTTAAVAKM